MTKTGRRKSERSTRSKLNSPGRPPVWQRENLCRFWRGVAAGHSSEVSAVAAGVSGPVGIRWFRSSGGMPPTHHAPSATPLMRRNLTFSEREEIALECARGTGIRAIAVTQHGIARDQAQFRDAQRGFRLSRNHGAVACGSCRTAPEAKQAGE